MFKKLSIFSENTGDTPYFRLFLEYFLDYLKTHVFDLFFECSPATGLLATGSGRGEPSCKKTMYLKKKRLFFLIKLLKSK